MKKEKAALSVRIIWFCRGGGILIAVFAFVSGLFFAHNPGDSFYNCFLALLFIALTFIPDIMKKRMKIYLPTGLQAAIVVFIFAAQILGEIRNFYARFPWWDTALHTLSGVILGYIGFLIIYSINTDRITRRRMNIAGVIAFAFFFAVGCGALWEILEFSIDFFLNKNTQSGVTVAEIRDMIDGMEPGEWFRDPGLNDTMKDLIMDTIGAVAAIVMGYFTIRRHHDRLISEFETHAPADGGTLN